MENPSDKNKFKPNCRFRPIQRANVAIATCACIHLRGHNHHIGAVFPDSKAKRTEYKDRATHTKKVFITEERADKEERPGAAMNHEKRLLAVE